MLLGQMMQVTPLLILLSSCGCVQALMEYCASNGLPAAVGWILSFQSLNEPAYF